MNVEQARTFLFVPGHRPDRFAKASASEADVVVLDLEDAVHPDRKTEARDNVRAWLAQANSTVVRINASGTPWHDEDLAAFSGVAAAIMVPKAEDPARLPTGSPVIPLIETPAGVLNAPGLCAAEATVRAAFGNVDLAAQLGVDYCSHDALRHARSALVLASAAAGLAAPIDGVTTALDDDGALRSDLDHAMMLGFTGKLCIHPKQVRIAHDALSPPERDIAWARELLAAVSEGSVTAYRGQMVDRPVLLRANTILARADHGGIVVDRD